MRRVDTALASVLESWPLGEAGTIRQPEDIMGGTRRSWLLIIAVPLLLAGCATYSDPALPRDQVAVLDTVWQLVGYATVVHSVDGQYAGYLPRKVTLLPGRRTVEIRFEASGQVMGRPIPLSFEAVAGRTYRAEGAIVEQPTAGQKGSWQAWIVDVQTNQVVAGRRP
jgi:hypothetical protein